MAKSGVIVDIDGAALKAARVAALMTQRELANEVGMSDLQISRLETGIQNSSANNLRKIAAALGVDLAQLMAK